MPRPAATRIARFTRTTCAACAAGVALTIALGAGAASATAQAPVGVSHPADGPSRIVSVNPFLPLFGYFSGEYEQRIKPNVAFAVSGSHVKFDNSRYTNFDAKLRLYPNDQALNGFSIATSLGAASIRRDAGTDCDLFSDCRLVEARTFSSPSFAIEGGYQWLLGRSKSTAITAGLGAKRYFGGSREDFSGIERVVPTGRLSIGYVF